MANNRSVLFKDILDLLKSPSMPPNGLSRQQIQAILRFPGTGQQVSTVLHSMKRGGLASRSVSKNEMGHLTWSFGKDDYHKVNFSLKAIGDPRNRMVLDWYNEMLDFNSKK